MNQRQQAIVNSYNKATASELREVYSSWSNDKEKAYKNCKKLCSEMNGERFRIISANGWKFTAGFLYKDTDGKTNLMYISKTGTEAIEL